MNIYNYTLMNINLSLSRTEFRKSPMDSRRGNPSSSDPMESVCRHLAPHHITDQFCSSALPFPVPVAIGLNPPAGKGNPIQVGCIGHVWRGNRSWETNKKKGVTGKTLRESWEEGGAIISLHAA